MKALLIFLIASSVTPLVAAAQPNRGPGENTEVQPPPVQKIVAGATSETDDEVSSLLAAKPEIPLGPLDVLKNYESEMIMIAQRMSAELASISQAVAADQLSRERADYLIGERYQIAMMQFQVLSTLHDSLARDVARAGVGEVGSGTTGSRTAVGIGYDGGGRGTVPKADAVDRLVVAVASNSWCEICRTIVRQVSVNPEHCPFVHSQPGL